MSLARTLRTVRRIPPRQLAHRLRFLWRRRRYAARPKAPFARAAKEAAGASAVSDLPRFTDDVLWPEGQEALELRAAEYARGRFRHLDRMADFSTGIRWRDDGATPLWLYQLQYLGSVLDLARTNRVEEAKRVLDSWRAEFEGRWDPVAWHPYPTSLRLANLCAAACTVRAFWKLGDGADALAAAHAAYLLRNVEHDVRGNHLLENARALLWAGRCLRGVIAQRCALVAREILEVEIDEQVLPDGGHFELSPMYHCIVLRDFLEMRELLEPQDAYLRKKLDAAVARMARFLAGIVCPDGDIPLLGDSSRNFGPPPAALLRLADVTPAPWTGVKSFPDTGLHVLRGAKVWAILDAGRTCPDYLPAHGQADALTIEAWVNGVRVVADPGVLDYSGPQRAYGRSSRAHSTITIDDEDTSEVYDSFRVGGRAEVVSVAIAEKADEVVATIRPYGTDATLTRSIRIYGESLTVEDTASAPAGSVVRSRMHLDPAVDFTPAHEEGRITGAFSLVADVLASGGVAHFEDGRVAPEFGRSVASKILVQETTEPGAKLRWVIGPA